MYKVCQPEIGPMGIFTKVMLALESMLLKDRRPFFSQTKKLEHWFLKPSFGILF